MSHRYRSILLLSALALIVPGSALAYIDEVIYPAHVEIGESFEVWVSGGMSESCWEYDGWTLNAYSDKLVVFIDTYRTADEGVGCPAVVIPYEVLATIPGQEEGIYILRIYESRVPRDPTILDFEVMVGAPVQTEPTSWEGLKALYR